MSDRMPAYIPTCPSCGMKPGYCRSWCTSSPSDADRAKAAEVIDAWDADDHGTYADLAARLAAALAAERAAAVEQITTDVRALAEELDRLSDEHWTAYKSASPDDPRRANPYTEGASDAYDDVAARLRAVVADTGEQA